MSVKSTRVRKASSHPQGAPDDLGREYRFDYSLSRPNRFARHFQGEVIAVVLDADVAEIFHDPRQVNTLLRAAIAALKAGKSGREPKTHLNQRALALRSKPTTSLTRH